MGRPTKEISPAVQKILLTLIKAGDSDRQVTRITGIQSREWRRLAAQDSSFAALLEKAIDHRGGGLGRSLRNAMLTQIRKGHPWWAKLAIHNYKTGLKDPDVASGVKLKRIIEKLATRGNDKDESIRVRAIVRTPPKPEPNADAQPD